MMPDSGIQNHRYDLNRFCTFKHGRTVLVDTRDLCNQFPTLTAYRGDFLQEFNALTSVYLCVTEYLILLMHEKGEPLGENQV